MNSLINAKLRRVDRDLQARFDTKHLQNKSKYVEVAQSNCSELGPEGKKKRVALKHPKIRTSKPLGKEMPHDPPSHSMILDDEIRFPTSTSTSATSSFVQSSSGTFTDSPIGAALPHFRQRSYDAKTASSRDRHSFYEFSKGNAIVNVTPAVAICNSTNISTLEGFERTIGSPLGSAVSKCIETRTSCKEDRPIRNQQNQLLAPIVRVSLDALNTNREMKKRKFSGDISNDQIKSLRLEEDLRTRSSIRAFPFSAAENLGSELIASLLHGDLKKTQVMTQRKNRRGKENKYSEDGEESTQNLHSKNRPKIFT